MKNWGVAPFILIFCFPFLAACRTTVQASPVPIVPSPVETSHQPNRLVDASTPVDCTCATMDECWGDWPATLTVLDCLAAKGRTCGNEPISSKQYAAHFNYAVSLENAGDLSSAIEQYKAALAIDAGRKEALDALIRLDALPEPTPPVCLPSATSYDPAPVETPAIQTFVQVRGDQLWLNGQPFEIKGVNYYPRHYPWRRFLTEAELPEMETELDLIRQAGFNTIRIFLWHDPLFTCTPDDAVPNEAAFDKVDGLFQLANERGLKLIVTLNDLPDLVFRPLYTDWPHYDAQLVYIVRRYRNEPNLLAWDLRNEGDLDYGARPGDNATLTQEEVVDWLAHASQLVRENDPYHLITAGWWGDPAITGPYVDFLSFHHWSSTEELANRLEGYKKQTEKPLLLEEVGYHSWADAPQDDRDEAEQAEILGQVSSLAESEQIAGWCIWTAFDFDAEPGQTASYENYFGLWRADLSPKPALNILPLD